MISKRAGPTPDTVTVCFEFPSVVRAKSVHLVGDFNGWDRHSHPLVWEEDDHCWRISLDLERNRTYQFRYLVDGECWHNDWNADRYVRNPFGGENSVLET